ISRALTELDQKMSEQSVIEEKKNDEIAQLRLNIDRAGGVRGKYMAMDSVFEAYRLYNIDSTMYYAYRKEDLALASRDTSLIFDAHLDIIRMNAISGLYVEALDGLSMIDTTALPRKSLYQYAETSVSLYESMSEIYSLHPQQGYYEKKLEESRNLLISLCDSTDVNRLYQEVSMALKSGDDLGTYIEKISGRLENDSSLTVHNKAILSYLLSLAYEKTGDKESALFAMIKSAEYDLSTPVREHKSLYELSAMLYERGDIERAYRYLSRSVDDLFKTKARVQMQSLEELLPVITSAYNAKKESDSGKLKYLLISLAVVSLFLLVAIFFVYKSKKKAVLLKVVAQKANLRLNESNSRLNDINKRLLEDDRIKEMYIGQYINMCSSYIDRIDKYRNNLLNIARTKGSKDVVEALKSSETVSSELVDFYYNFDKSFLHLYPDFVDKFNALIREDCRFDIKPGKPLNTELRVFALIRLGITDSNRIAEFLRRSVSTIYNYRVKMRNAAIADRENFEQQVQNIGKTD
ncbi:MAG TPA: hypothetical protein IAC93_03875, partial [Candidatus Limisoma gallistercoris]|nr:hypothetical protein [Candidatus Limisoma gallistercoris]